MIKPESFFWNPSPTPSWRCLILKRLAELPKNHRVVTVLDNTVTTPYLLRAKKWGMNIEIVSTTKYISGGATSVGGVIIDHGNFPWAAVTKLEEDARRFGPHTLLMKLRREVYRNLGACLSAHNAYLQTLGLETIAPPCPEKLRECFEAGGIPIPPGWGEEGQLSGPKDQPPSFSGPRRYWKTCMEASSLLNWQTKRNATV